jgi:hypothetical protein
MGQWCWGPDRGGNGGKEGMERFPSMDSLAQGSAGAVQNSLQVFSWSYIFTSPKCSTGMMQNQG